MTIQSFVGFIYCLEDPNTGEVRYVGQTRGSLQNRLTGHLKAARNPTQHVHRWIAKIGGKAVIRLLEKTDELDAAERRWIAKLRKRGARLCNETDGGESSHG